MPQQQQQLCGKRTSSSHSKEHEEHTIRSSFDVLDDDKIGIIDVRTFQTLWLGLGYGKISIEELTAMLGVAENITVDVVLDILMSQTEHQGGGDEFLVPPLMTAQGLVDLAKVAGETITMDEANAMMDGKESWTDMDIKAILSKEQN